MSYAKPIWNEVTSCRYKNSPSWGGFNDVKQTTYTGSSTSNSQELATIEISRKFYTNFVVFNYYIDKKLYKQNINFRNGDKAGKFIQQRKSNFLNSSNEMNHLVNRKLK
jgi:hypothetical protein